MYKIIEECYNRPNSSQIGWSAYAYVTYQFEIKIFMFYSKNYLTRIFLFFCFIKIWCVQRCQKFQENSYLEKKFFNVIFKRLLFY